MKKKSVSALWSASGLWVGIVIVAYLTNSYNMLIPELLSFFKGNISELRENTFPFTMMMPVILAVISIEFPCCIAGIILQKKIAGKSGRNYLSGSLDDLEKGSIFFNFFILVLLEEIIARWLFLGVLTKIPLLDSKIGFIILFLAGNGVWSIMHIFNFEDEKDRKVIRVLPQFIAGIFISYVYIKYGLIGAILAHFTHNSILLGTHKVQDWGIKNILMLAYSLLALTVSYCLMEKPISDIMIWFSDKPNFALKGWQFWDYMKISIFLYYCFTIIFEILLYDRGDDKQIPTHEIIAKVGIISPLLIIVGVTYIFYYLLFNLLGLMIDSVSYRVLVLAIVLLSLSPIVSGSSASRTFWMLPNSYISVCIMQALGLWLALLYVLVSIVVTYPQTIIRKIDN